MPDHRPQSSPFQDLSESTVGAYGSFGYFRALTSRGYQDFGHHSQSIGDRKRPSANCLRCPADSGYPQCLVGPDAANLKRLRHENDPIAVSAVHALIGLGERHHPGPYIQGLASLPRRAAVAL